MPRRGRITKRLIKKDSKYGSVLVSKFINKIMYAGKKNTAENIFYKSMEEIKNKLNKNPLEVFELAIKNAAPLMEVKPRRVGGSTYQIPVEVERERGIAIAMKWIINSSRERQGKSMIQKLTSEIMDVYSGVGGAVKKREDLHKTAEANKAFAHFRW